MSKKNTSISLQNYTLRYLVVALLAVIAVWAGLFYAVILEEVYDNIDDGLKNSKIQIIREMYAHPELLNTREFGINQFKITPLPKDSVYDFSDKFISTFEFMEYDDDDEPVRLLETVFNDPRGRPYKLTIRASIVEEDELLEDLLTALVALYIMMVASIALLNRYLVQKAWKPFYNILDRLKQYSPGSGKTFEKEPSVVTEFRVLSEELQALLKRNEAVYASQKQFIENASHELQTPLAISLNKLDLFAENNTLPEEQMAELGKITDTLQRLVRLNKSLLMLSKIENRQFTESESVNFNTLIAQLAEDFEDMAVFKGIHITVSGTGQLVYTINKGLAISLLSNLIKNAIIHNYKGGSVDIAITSTSVTIQNTGKGYPLDETLIYRRFYRDIHNGQSTGLGLALVQAIAAIYNIKINYTFTDQHSFTFIFPEKQHLS
ncbi:sensor histidine kinase [Flavobacterium rhizosphaerae]|uniref:histidine kinase n=1 Tax=Flavobacterium rhizosphaerae TaxID=3163298 RepID=A0ABW8YU41_9FLAO